MFLAQIIACDHRHRNTVAVISTMLILRRGGYFTGVEAN
jgi:hypothetical protein